MNKWWGYLHINGSVQVKRVFDQRSYDIARQDAQESDFVIAVTWQFDAIDRADALRQAEEILK